MPVLTQIPDVNNPDSWLVAKRVAAGLGPMPSSVGNAVKSLWKDHLVFMETGRVEVSATANSTVRLLDKSSVLKMPLFFAAQSLYPERFPEVKDDDTSRALIRILHPGLFAAFLSLLYVHRRFNKICPEESWGELSKEFILNMELGYLIGKGCPRIGEAIGVLMGGVRYAALALLMKQDVQKFTTYRNKKLTFNVPYEHETWGTDHGQIAGILLRALGIHPDPIQSAYAIRGHGDSPLQTNLLPWAVVIRFMDAVKGREQLSSVDLTDLPFQITGEDISGIQQSTDTLFEKGSTFSWMLKKSKEEE